MILKKYRESQELKKVDWHTLRPGFEEDKKCKPSLLLRILGYLLLFIPPIFLYIYQLWKQNRKIKKVKLKDKSNNEQVAEYNWDLLLKSVKKYGSIKPLDVVKKSNTPLKYEIGDGNHRYMVLRDLFDDNFLVTVNIVNE